MKENDTMTDRATILNIDANVANLMARVERLEAMNFDGVAEPFDTHFVPKSEYDEAIERADNAEGSLAEEKIKIVDMLRALERIAEKMAQKYGPSGR